VSGPQFRRMMVDGVPVMANTAAGAFFLQGYPLIINAALGPVAVVTLTTIRTASRTLLQITGMVSNASSSEMSRTYGARDWNGYLRLLKVLVAVTIWTSLAVGAALTLVGPWVIAKWTLGRVLVDHWLLLFFAISVACQSCWSACGSILFSTNMHHAFNYANLVLTLAGLAAADVLIRHIGFIGTPLVMMSVDALLLALALYLCHRKLSFISLASLLSVLNPLFYLRKMDYLMRSSFARESRPGA
jgi:O-antigen/teichoic acid export membrane protein